MVKSKLKKRSENGEFQQQSPQDTVDKQYHMNS